MVEVILGENDRLDWALKQFRRKLIRSGTFKDLKKGRFYEKPSEAKSRENVAPHGATFCVSTLSPASSPGMIPASGRPRGNRAARHDQPDRIVRWHARQVR